MHSGEGSGMRRRMKSDEWESIYARVCFASNLNYRQEEEESMGVCRATAAI